MSAFKLFKKKMKLVWKDAQLPTPDTRALELIRAFKGAFRLLEDEHFLNQPNNEWEENLRVLRSLCLSRDPRNFMHWEVIQKTMFTGDLDYLEKEHLYLQKSSRWDAIWKHALPERPIGLPISSKLFPGSSGNRVHHAYHLERFLEASSSDVQQFDGIIEFGGGYGNLCQLALQHLDYRGKYCIFDFPEFNHIQSFYLESLGLETEVLQERPECSRQILIMHQIEHLKEQISKFKNPLFIATWSISETSLSFRESFASCLAPFKNFLFAYQDTFENVDNHKYFSSLMEQCTDTDWSPQSIEHLNGSQYLFGTSKS